MQFGTRLSCTRNFPCLLYPAEHPIALKVRFFQVELLEFLLPPSTRKRADSAQLSIGDPLLTLQNKTLVKVRIYLPFVATRCEMNSTSLIEESLFMKMQMSFLLCLVIVVYSATFSTRLLKVERSTKSMGNSREPSSHKLSYSLRKALWLKM